MYVISAHESFHKVRIKCHPYSYPHHIPGFSPFRFILCVSLSFMVGWAFQALSGLFKFLTSGRKKQRDWRENPPSEIEGIFPMKCCAVTWNRLCLLCLLMWLAPFNQMLNAMHALAFTVQVGLQRIFTVCPGGFNCACKFFSWSWKYLTLALAMHWQWGLVCLWSKISVKRIANHIRLQYSVMPNACFPWWKCNWVKSSG